MGRQAKTIERRVTLTGLRPIMFDRYPGSNDEKLEPIQKMYIGEDGKTVVLPVENISSFLSAVNSMSAPKRLYDPRKYKNVCLACMSFVGLEPQLIPFQRNGKGIKFNEVGDGSGIYIYDRTTPRLKNGVPNPNPRPVLPMPWSLQFTLSLFENSEINESEVKNLFIRGGVTVGLGTYRGVYGKFAVEEWK